MKLATRGLGVLVALLVSLPLCASAQTVAAGQWHSVVLMPDGHVWTWGSNYYGQLGTDEASWVIHPSPVVVPNLDNVIAVAAGEVHTLALKNDGTVVAWGENGGGQIGDGTTDWRYHPVAVTGLSNIIAIAAKGYQSMALAADGTVYTWGLNWYGNLGDGTNVERHVPTVSTGLSGAVAIGQGYWASYAVKTDGTVWAAGGNIGQEFSNGGGPFWTPIQMGTVANVTAIAGGFDFSLALENDQTLWSAGSNISGQLGTGNPSGTSPAPLTTLSPVTAIATGYRHAMALVTDGTVWSWGQNDAGQLGDGTTINRGIPVAVSGLNNIAAIACGTLHCLAVGADGTVYTWGMNDHGQLGNGSIDTQFSGIFSPTAHAISGPGYVWKVPPPALSAATGTYTSDLTVSISSPVDGVELHYTLNGGDPTQADTAIANGGVITIDRTRTLKARGWKTGWTTSAISTRVYTMQVADVAIAPASGLYPAPLTVAMSTSTPPATIYYTTDGSTPTQASAVYSSPLTVTTATTVKAYATRSGWNASNVSSAAYEISQGTLSTPVIAPASGSYTSSVTVSISAGAGAIHYTTDNSTPSEASPLYTAPFVLSASATVKARAFQGQYFPSDTAFASYEIVVADPAITPPGGTYAGTQTITVASATAGADVHYTLDGTDPTQASPTIAASGHLLIGAYTLKARAWKTGCTPSAIVSATFTTSGALTTPAIAAGYGISLALRSDGQLWDWGNNSYTELGDGTGTSRGTPALVPGLTGVRQIVSGAVHVMAVMSDSSLVVWGDNFDGRLGLGNYSPQSRPVAVPGLTNITSVDGGSQHTIVLLNDGTVVTMGLNNYGQLGDGTNTGRPTAAAVPGLTNITAVKAGPYSSLALRSDGTVWAWGFNQYGQLGEGTNGNRNTPTQVSGLSNVRTLDGGYLSSAAITTDGTLWTWGDNSYGQLGDAGPSRNVPGAVPGLTYVSQVAVGDYHVVALRSDGTVWTFGRNLEGQLGDGTTTGRATPMQVAGLSDIVQVAAGEYHSMALAADGTVWVWGRNYNGTIGDGSWQNALVPVAITIGSLSSRPSAPVIAPGSGTFTSAQTVTITTASAPAGTTIHYTLDGSDPTLQSLLYAGPLSITTRTVITARAFRPGLSPSRATTATLIFDYGTLATPTASPAGGNFQASVNVAISGPASSTIRYTTDGNDPTESSTVYSAPLTFSNTTTLKARAYRADWAPSAVLTEAYVNPCVFTVAPGAITAGSHAGGGVLAVTAGDPGCAWNATANVPWITLGVAGGSGSGAVPYVIAANADATARQGVLSIAGQTIVVSQGAAACTFSLTPGGIAATANATVGTIGVTPSDASCTWSASSDAAWATFTIDPQTSAYKRAVLADHPVGYWRLDAAPNATTVADATAGAHDGAVTGTVTFGAAGAIADGATAAVFDGTTATIAIPHDAAFVLPALSWEAWINVPQVADHQRRILGKGAANETFALWMNANATQPTIVWTSVGGGHQSATLSTNVIAAGWVHIAFAYDGLTWHAYVNGVEDQTGTQADTLVSNSQSLLFGREDATPATAWYDGQLQDVAVYPYALSAAQIANHYALRTAVWSGTGTLAYTIAENQTGTARSATMTIAGVPVPVQQGNTGDLIITGYVTPSPNSAGWNNTNVTVSFACAGPGTVTCPAAVPVTTEGVQEITGTATNDLGQSATAIVTVRVDKTAPVLTILAPVRNAIVSSGTLTVLGKASDTSQVRVLCDGILAAVTDNIFSCNVTVPTGGRSIVVDATDEATNTTSTTLTVGTSDALPSEPTNLRITPQHVTMLLGEFRRFSLRDNLGRMPEDAVWTVDDASVATIVTSPVVALGAEAVGHVTVTATWHGLTATTEVTVLSGTALPSGTVRWAVEPITAPITRIVRSDEAFQGTQRSFALEHNDGASDMIRAFDGDGTERWRVDAGGTVTQLSATQRGGAVAAVSTSAGDRFVRAIDADGAATNIPGSNWNGFAIYPEGPLYHIDLNDDLVGVDIGRGAGFRVPLPRSELRDCTGGTFHNPTGCTSTWFLEAAGTPTVLWEGDVVVPVVTSVRTVINGYTSSFVDRRTISVLVLKPNGQTEVRPVSSDWDSTFMTPLKVIPNGAGDLLVTWNETGWLGPNDQGAIVATLYADGHASIPADIGRFWGDLVVGEQGDILATTYAGHGPGSTATLRRLTYLTPDSDIRDSIGVEGKEVSSMAASAGGGFVVNYSDGQVTGPDPAYADLHLREARYLSDGVWLGIGVGTGGGPTVAASVTDALTATAGPIFALAATDWPWPSGRWDANAPRVRNVTTTRLWQIAIDTHIVGSTETGIQANYKVAGALQELVLKCIDKPENKRRFPSQVRANATGGSPAAVIPDFVGPVAYNEFGDQISRRLIKDGHFLEVKAVNGLIGLDYSRYQIAGFVDVAEQSMVQVAEPKPLPVLQFVTTFDTTLAPDLVVRAYERGIALKQRVVEETIQSRLRVSEYHPVYLQRTLSRTWFQGLLNSLFGGDLDLGSPTDSLPLDFPHFPLLVPDDPDPPDVVK